MAFKNAATSVCKIIQAYLSATRVVGCCGHNVHVQSFRHMHTTSTYIKAMYYIYIYICNHNQLYIHSFLYIKLFLFHMFLQLSVLYCIYRLCFSLFMFFSILSHDWGAGCSFYLTKRDTSLRLRVSSTRCMAATAEFHEFTLHCVKQTCLPNPPQAMQDWPSLCLIWPEGNSRHQTEEAKEEKQK